MRNAEPIGRIEGLGISRGAGKVRQATARMTVPFVVAAMVVTVMPAREATVSTTVRLSADSTALIMGFTSLPTPDKVYIDAVGNQFIAPTHSGQDIEYVPVTTPEEGWPLTGVIRLSCAAVGAQNLCGPGGAAWPDEPWWKLSGLFDLTINQSEEAGLADLEKAMAAHPSDHLVIYGYSQGATIANLEKQRLAEQYPAGTTPPDIDFVLGGDLNLPNGGLEARFPGLHIPILNWSFNGPEPTDTAFDTVVVTRQYDGVADFPLYPLNLIADLNAILGSFYVHLNGFDVSLADDTSVPTVSMDPTGKTAYYFFETQDLPLFGPLRTLGVPESLIDVVEPFFREIVELGYDRSIKPWEPTPARLIPTTLDPAKVATDLVNAIGEGIDNAAALIGSPAPLSTPAAVTAATAGPADAAPAASEAGKSDDSPQVTPADTRTETEQLTSAEPSARPTTPRPVVRGSLEVRKQLRDLPHRGSGGHPSTRTGAAGHGAATAAPSPAASSPAASKGRDSSDGDSSGGDAGDS